MKYKISRSDVFCKKIALKKIEKFTRKHLCRNLFLIKMQACNFIKKRIPYTFFPANFADFLRAPIM